MGAPPTEWVSSPSRSGSRSTSTGRGARSSTRTGRTCCLRRPAGAPCSASSGSRSGSATTSSSLDQTPKRAAESATEMVQVVLPNDANPLGFILGGTVMHLIDIAGAIACHRHTRSLLVTAAVDDLQFLHSIKVGDLIILQSRVTCTFVTSLEAQVEVYSEETLTGKRLLTSRAFLTFVAVARDGSRVPVTPLLVETDEERRVSEEAQARRRERLKKKSATKSP